MPNWEKRQMAYIFKNMNFSSCRQAAMGPLADRVFETPGLKGPWMSYRVKSIFSEGMGGGGVRENRSMF